LFFKAGDYEKAIDWILKYIRKFDRDFQARRLLGECYEKLRFHDVALDSYKQSLQIKPNQVNTYHQLVKVVEFMELVIKVFASVFVFIKYVSCMNHFALCLLNYSNTEWFCLHPFVRLGQHDG